VTAAVGQAANVVDVENINAGQAKPLLARLPRGHHPLEAIIKFGVERQGRAEAVTFGGSAKGRIRLQQSAYFARQDDPVVSPQGIAYAPLAESKSVIRRGVEIGDASVDGGNRRIPGIAVADGPIEVAERRGAKAQFRHVECGFPDGASRKHCGHDLDNPM